MIVDTSGRWRAVWSDNWRLGASPEKVAFGRSLTVGMPSGLVLPSHLGMSTRLTG
jgi:hypothetical protein